MSYIDTYNEWLSNPYFDADTRKELESLRGDEKEIEDRFYKNLEFGTAGLRGVIGAGTNRMNDYTVGKATQGLANYILAQGGDAAERGVVIAHDSRRFSPEFSKTAALVLAGNGVKAYLFDSLRPTPELSFAVVRMGCTAGIVITASHNPPEYNGYKCYWSYGGQVPAPRDGEITDEVNKVTDFATIKKMDEAEALEKGLLTYVTKEIDDEFVANVKAQSLHPELATELDDFKIVYTPLHGTGNIPVRRALDEMGFKNVYIVPEQAEPDENFSTVGYPNPEDPKAFALALKLAEEVGADIACATDPDADRVGAAVKDANGNYVLLTGNMMGALLTEYILSQRKAKDDLPADGVVISTVVSTNVTKAIAEEYGVEYMEVLTGFKYIGEKIHQFEVNGGHSYIFGFEESYGCLSGTYARDKDAIVATVLICEMAAWYKKRGLSLYDGLLELYEKYGYYRETVESITLKGKEGLEKIASIMAGLREQPLASVGGQDVVETRDYKNDIICKDGKTSTTGLPTSDVLYYVLADGSWFCIRPSGTEPKIKIYCGVKGETLEAADAALGKLAKDVSKALISE